MPGGRGPGAGPGDRTSPAKRGDPWEREVPVRYHSGGDEIMDNFPHNSNNANNTNYFSGICGGAGAPWFKTNQFI